MHDALFRRGAAHSAGHQPALFSANRGISLFAHRKNGYLDKAVLCAAIPTGTLCALAAAFLTTMVDSSVFRKPFGLFLLYAGLSILFEKKKNSKKETP